MRTSKLPIVGLIILGILALFLVQNGSPTLSVTFLGGASVPLPLGVWLLIPFVAGLITAWLMALVLPRRHESGSRSTRTTQKPPRFGSEQSNPNLGQVDDSNWTDERLESSPGKTLSDDDRSVDALRGKRTDSSWPPQAVEQKLEEPETEIWDDEEWEEEERSDEVNVYSSESTAIGTYEVQQEPVSAYRQGTLYSYSYNKSALRDNSNAENSELQNSKPENSEPGDSDTNRVESSRGQQPSTSRSLDELGELDELDELEDDDINQVEEVTDASEFRANSETNNQDDEIIEGEFLDNSEKSDVSQDNPGFLRSQLLKFRSKASEDDDWNQPPTPPEDW